MAKETKSSGKKEEPRETQPPESDPQEDQGGVAVIDGKALSSDPPKPKESDDVEYLSLREVIVGEEINTLRTVLVEHPEHPENWNGPWIQRCIGRSPETKKLQVVRIPAQEQKIQPTEVMQYLGSVVQDLSSVHTGNVIFKKRRWGYCFDRFFYFNGKKIHRVCWVPNRVHQAGLIYEKVVDRKSRKTLARIRQIKGHLGQPTGEPMYKVIGAKEDYYRDLKRLYERYYLKRGEEALAEDVGLKVLVGGQT